MVGLMEGCGCWKGIEAAGGVEEDMRFIIILQLGVVVTHCTCRVTQSESV
jgi:hypothetical protein